MAAPRIDPYTVLGVGRAATDAEIRAAYRALVERYHPDRHQGNPLEDLASQRMAEINQAYDVLSDPARRAAFDRGWGDPLGGRAGGATGGGAGDPARAAARRRGMSPALKWGLLILALPLLLRTGVGLLRGLARLLGALFGELGAFRGTPAALVAAVLVAGLLTLALVRRYRRRKR
jgi:curved DNA-binding protein CbpA